jgi:hypothetical protein
MLYDGLQLKDTRIAEGKYGHFQEPVTVELYEDTDEGYYNCFIHYMDGSRAAEKVSTDYLRHLARKQNPHLRLVRVGDDK